MTVVETLLVYLVAPGVLYGGIWLLVAARRRAGRTRWKPGDPWPYEPLFWIANPAGADHPAHAAHDADRTESRRAGTSIDADTPGGTGGKW